MKTTKLIRGWYQLTDAETDMYFTARHLDDGRWMLLDGGENVIEFYATLKAAKREALGQIENMALQMQEATKIAAGEELQEDDVIIAATPKTPVSEFLGHVWDVNGSIPYVFDTSYQLYVNRVDGGFVGIVEDHNTDNTFQSTRFISACDAATIAYAHYLQIEENKGA